MDYLGICLISLGICIGVAEYRKMSLSSAILLGFFLSPAAGIGYIYILISDDRNPWRIVPITIGVSLLIILIVLVATGYIPL